MLLQGRLPQAYDTAVAALSGSQGLSGRCGGADLDAALWPTPARVRQLQELAGVSRRTLSRWRQWWREVFVASPFWRAHTGAFMPPVSTADLPASLLQRFAADLTDQLVSLLRWLAPLSSPQSMRGS